MLRYACAAVIVLVIAGCGRSDVESTAVILSEVTDGDTVRLIISGSHEAVRLIGVNTPEHDECHGTAAKEALELLLATGNLRVERGETDERDRFGRLLAYLYAGNTLVNLTMIEGGHGLATTSGHDLQDGFLAADERAWALQLGMWDPGACGARSSLSIEIDTVEADPPGDDTQRPNDEFVVLRNLESEVVDTSGWRIRDESSSQRDAIPDGTVIAPRGVLTLHSGCGSDTSNHLYWCEGPVWSNGGDAVILQTPTGTVVDRLRYDGN